MGPSCSDSTHFPSRWILICSLARGPADISWAATIIFIRKEWTGTRGVCLPLTYSQKLSTLLWKKSLELSPDLYSSLCLTFRIALILVSPSLPVQERHPKLGRGGILPCTFVHSFPSAKDCQKLQGRFYRRTRWWATSPAPSFVAHATCSRGAEAEVPSGSGICTVDECRSAVIASYLINKERTLSYGSSNQSSLDLSGCQGNDISKMGEIPNEQIELLLTERSFADAS